MNAASIRSVSRTYVSPIRGTRKRQFSTVCKRLSLLETDAINASSSTTLSSGHCMPSAIDPLSAPRTFNIVPIASSTPPPSGRFSKSMIRRNRDTGGSTDDLGRSVGGFPGRSSSLVQPIVVPSRRSRPKTLRRNPSIRTCSAPRSVSVKLVRDSVPVVGRSFSADASLSLKTSKNSFVKFSSDGGAAGLACKTFKTTCTSKPTRQSVVILLLLHSGER